MTFLLLGSALFLLIFRTRSRIDHWIEYRIFTLRQKNLSSEEEALPWLQHIMRGIRSGNTLADSLQSFAASHQENVYGRVTDQILLGEPNENSLVQFMSESLRGGAPILAPLRFLHRRLERRVHGLRRARALTAQARLQASVIFFAPWGLLATLTTADPEMARQAVADPRCLLVWGLALFMSFLGLLWIRHILKTAILPKTEAAILDDQILPELLLHAFARISAGQPIEEAVRNSMPKKAPDLVRTVFTDLLTVPPVDAPFFLLEVQATLRAALLNGCPLKEEIERILQDCESRRDARMEEMLQKLPIKILAPLFICVLPSALLILFSFLLPSLSQWT